MRKHLYLTLKLAREVLFLIWSGIEFHTWGTRYDNDCCVHVRRWNEGRSSELKRVLYLPGLPWLRPFSPLFKKAWMANLSLVMSWNLSILCSLNKGVVCRDGRSGAHRSGAPERRSEKSERERERRSILNFGAGAGAPLHFTRSANQFCAPRSLKF